ncbi:MAG: thiol reductase thioredoxin [Spirochaetales bacterium]|jgi:ribonucleoside-triphosphate reductase|nr:thiol reductase thioredoxin [Spirochaetales bacterium]
MRSAETITKEIEELKLRLANVKGTETEVYTRIVGYYRSLRNWNRGKREEYNGRLPFQVDSSETGTSPENGTLKTIAAYRYFYRKGCPNCLPVREFISRLPLEGRPVDVDTEDGLNEARESGVQSTPTVVFYDTEGRAKLRGYSVSELEKMFAAV